jgi:hypothetical protein
VTVAVTGNTISCQSCLASDGADVSGASTAVDRKSMKHTVAERSWKDADFVCISCIKCVGYGEML